ncbi:hypothetical protein OAG47_01285 [Verrucomicrobiales bacterium]|jgi:hypothetical protein|nr:hypothetical protein [Verrucomicrobiales bacterium]MDB4789504.1 hypothetical protein [Verrucomicrobiales bacterium]
MRGKFGKLLQIKLYYLLGAVLLAPDFDEPEERCGGELAMGVVSLQQLLIARGRLRQALRGFLLNESLTKKFLQVISERFLSRKANVTKT